MISDRSKTMPLPAVRTVMQTYVDALQFNCEDTQLRCSADIRKLVSMDEESRDEVIQDGALSIFVEFLDRDDHPGLQLEATGVIRYITSGTSEQIQAVIDHGSIPLLVKLLGNVCAAVREQAVLALGNVAGHSLQCRGIVLCHGALPPLLDQFNDNTWPSMLKSATWALSKICMGNPPTPFEQIKDALSVLKQVLSSTQEDVLSDACSALNYITNMTDEEIQAVIEAGVCPKLFDLLRHTSPIVVYRALYSLDKIVTRADAQAEIIIDLQALSSLSNLLANNSDYINTFSACHLISKIIAGSKNQIQAVVNVGIVTTLVQLLKNTDLGIKRQAARALSLITCRGTPQQVKYLTSKVCIEALCDLLVYHPFPDCVLVCLNILDKILQAGEDEKRLGIAGSVNLAVKLIDGVEGTTKIKELQNKHKDVEISKKALHLLTTFWEAVDES